MSAFSLPEQLKTGISQERSPVTDIEASTGESPNALAAPAGAALVWGGRTHGLGGHWHSRLVSCGPARRAHPLGAGARPTETFRSASAAMHRPATDAVADAAWVRVALASGGDLGRGPRPFGFGDATAMGGCRYRSY